MTPIYLQDHRPAARRFRLALLVVSLVAAALIVGAAWKTAHAQTPVRVTVRDSVQYKFVATPIHDTVLVTRCYNAAMQLITCPTTPPIVPPDSTPPSGTHEPSGMTRVTERPFSALVEDGWSPMNIYTNPAGRFTITQDATAPKSPASVGQMKYPAGWGGGSAPADLFSKSFPSACGTVYIAFWAKYSADFYGHDASSVNKIIFVYSGGAPGTVIEAFGSGMNTLRPVIVLQGGENVVLNANVNTSVVVKRGSWQKWEMVGTLPGTLDLWLDGVQVGHWTGRKIGGTSWAQALFAPNFGGVGGTVPHDQYLWMDHFYASCK